MKRSFSFRQRVVLASGLGLVAATYGLVRLAYGLFLPDVQRDLGLDPGTAGWIASGASAVYCAGAVAGFLLATRAPRALVAAATALAAGGAVGMATATGPVWFGTASVLGSAAAGIASPALVRVVGDLVPEDRRGRAQAVVNAGTGPGLVAAGVLALVLLPDWRTAWAWSGVVAVVVGTVLLVSARPARTARTAGRRTDVGPRPVPGAHWFAAHRGPVALAAVFGAGSAVVWTYGRSVLVAAGASTVVSVSAWIAVGLGGAAVVLTARWTSPLRARTLWAVAGTPTALAVLALGAVPRSTALALVACAVFGWGYTAATGALIAWTDEIDARHAAAGTSVLFVALVLGQAVGAAAGGTLLGVVGSPATFLVGGVVTAASALAGLAVRATAGVRSAGCTPPTPRSPHAVRSRGPAGP